MATAKKTSRQATAPTDNQAGLQINDPELLEMLADAAVPVIVQKEVATLVEQIRAAKREITPTDRLQLRDYALACTQSRNARRMSSLITDDVVAYGRMIKIVESAETLKRGLLRDLKLTRLTTAVEATPAAVTKLNQKSGSTWTGVI
jgi:hypothetical protein